MSEEFTVTVLSNASTDIYHDNTVFSFTNILNKELDLPIKENWQVCLTSISMTNIVDQSEQTLNEYYNRKAIFQTTATRFKAYLAQNEINSQPKTPAQIATENSYLKRIYGNYLGLQKTNTDLFYEQNPVFLECEQIIPKHGSSKTLAVFIIPPTHYSHDFITYEPKTEEYFSLLSNLVTQLTFRIKNGKNEVLTSTFAQPTIIRLKFKKMELDQTNHHTIFIDNGTQNPVDFLVKFPNTLVRDGQQNPWEIALTRISFIPIFKKYPSGKCYITAIAGKEDFLQVVHNFNSEKVENYIISNLNGKTEFEYSEELSGTELYDFLIVIFKLACAKIGIKIQIQFSNKRFQLRAEEDIVFHLPKNLILALGIDAQDILYYKEYGFLVLKGKETLASHRKTDFKFMLPHNLLIYTDCVIPSLIGNVFGQYLTSVPVASNDEKVPFLSYEPKHLEFHPLCTGDLSNIRIKLLKTDGSTPEFLNNGTKIFISILFQRKIKK